MSIQPLAGVLLAAIAKAEGGTAAANPASPALSPSATSRLEVEMNDKTNSMTGALRLAAKSAAPYNT